MLNRKIQVVSGLEIPGLIMVANACASVLKVRSNVCILPMKFLHDDKAFVTRDTLSFKLHLSKSIIEKDEANKETARLFIHELTHVKQMEDGELILADHGNIVIWRGKKYNPQMDYNIRPWEKDARRAESKYIKEVWNIINTLQNEN